MATTKKKVELLDDAEETKSEKDDEMPGEKMASNLTHEIGVFAKAAALYFDKLSEINTKSVDKKPEKAFKEMMSTAQKASKVAMKHVTENSEAHKEAKRQAKKMMPGSAVEDMNKWMDEDEED